MTWAGGGAGDYGESVECDPNLAPLISRGNYVLSPSPSPVNMRTTGHLHYLHLPSIYIPARRNTSLLLFTFTHFCRKGCIVAGHSCRNAASILHCPLLRCPSVPPNCPLRGNMKLRPIPVNVRHSQQQTCDLLVGDTCPANLSTELREKCPHILSTYCV